MRFLEKSGAEMRQEDIQKWLDTHKAMLTANEISVVVKGFERWELPSSEELHRLGRISGYPIPEAFGPSEHQRAVNLFANGDVKDCIATFSRMLLDKETADTLSNLAFCQILTGDI